MPEARTHRLLLALTVVMAALFCAPATAPGKALQPHEIAPGDLWEPQPERVRVELVRIPGSHLVDLAIVTENASGRTKWLSRDPLGEAGGLNLYGFVGNDPVNNWDYLGLVFTPKHLVCITAWRKQDDEDHDDAWLTELLASKMLESRYLYD